MPDRCCLQGQHLLASPAMPFGYALSRGVPPHALLCVHPPLNPESLSETTFFEICGTSSIEDDLNMENSCPSAGVQLLHSYHTHVCCEAYACNCFLIQVSVKTTIRREPAEQNCDRPMSDTLYLQLCPCAEASRRRALPQRLVRPVASDAWRETMFGHEDLIQSV